MANKRRARRLALPRNELLTVKSLARYLNKAEKTVYNLVSAARKDPAAPGAIPFALVGGSLRFVPEEIERWVAESSQRSARGVRKEEEEEATAEAIAP